MLKALYNDLGTFDLKYGLIPSGACGSLRNSIVDTFCIFPCGVSGRSFSTPFDPGIASETETR